MWRERVSDIMLMARQDDEMLIFLYISVVVFLCNTTRYQTMNLTLLTFHGVHRYHESMSSLKEISLCITPDWETFYIYRFLSILFLNLETANFQEFNVIVYIYYASVRKKTESSKICYYHLSLLWVSHTTSGKNYRIMILRKRKNSSK